MSDNKQLKHKLKGVGEYAGGEAERLEKDAWSVSGMRWKWRSMIS